MQWTQFEHQRIDVEIKWTTPKTFEEIQEMEEEKCQNTYFYKIVGRYNDKFKLFYIGKCVQQYVTTRIFQKDHIVKQVLFKEAHKRHTFMVCLGNLTDEQKHKPKEIGNAESLLIYSHTHSDFSYIKNK